MSRKEKGERMKKRTPPPPSAADFSVDFNLYLFSPPTSPGSDTAAALSFIDQPGKGINGMKISKDGRNRKYTGKYLHDNRLAVQ